MPYPWLDTFELLKKNAIGVLVPLATIEKEPTVSMLPKEGYTIKIKQNTPIYEELVVRAYSGKYRKKLKGIDIPLKVVICGDQKIETTNTTGIEKTFFINDWSKAVEPDLY